MSRALSPRQREALLSYARLGSMKDAAAALDISEHTLKQHLEKARLKLGVETTVQAVRHVLK